MDLQFDVKWVFIESECALRIEQKRAGHERNVDVSFGAKLARFERKFICICIERIVAHDAT